MKPIKRLKRREILNILGDRTVTMDELIGKIIGIKTNVAGIEARSCVMPLIYSGQIIKTEDGHLKCR